METFTVYILHSASADKFYVGHTNNISRRITEHNDPYVTSHSSKFTLKNGPWVLAYSEAGFPSRVDAMKREKTIKSWKSKVAIQKLIAEQSCVAGVNTGEN